MALTKIKTSNITDDSVTNSKIADDAVQTENVASSVNLGRRNLLINGDMRVAQRSVASITGINGSGYYTVDRWNYNRDFTEITTQKREYASPPAGFKYYWKITVTTADTSIT